MAVRRRPVIVGATVAIVLIAVLLGWWIGGRSTTEPTVAAPPPAPARITIVPGPGAAGVDPLGAVRVAAADGVLTDVRMTNDEDKPVPGVLTPDAQVWKPSVPLGYGRTYTLTVNSRGVGGVPATQTSTFSTLTPGNQTKVTLTTTSGAELTEGGTYGVGVVVVAHFDEPITDRAAAQRRLVVTTKPAVQGSWYWVDDQNAHWRPQHYYRSGTTVSAAANVYGANLGGGLYGQEDTKVSFAIGDAHVSVADDSTKTIQVYNNGQLVRTIPTSMGMGGTETVGDQTFSFWTQPGTYTVMDKANPVVMDSSTYGLPINSRLGYKETIHYAVRLSTDGIYIHQLESTVWAQGNTNVSHGCLNVNTGNARWFYDFSQPGDVVEVRNTGGQPLQIWQNGDWSVPWDEWLAGSAEA
ncbi:L,D-transpeptidase [Mycolicibacterium pallens]|uniref:L,D-transpeptidase family protein n=1 Tax=Mycolicibacterium pallens TaxID=370524 RepID=A0ABX8VM11_9MYCO|nr:Ig-like domain-containing protein [Mycolicibacterium pallens]QYL18824.1 L,D-transpeptidase family protein [Mycolicibacterium pallens]